jgi:hypothetical protein
MSSQIVITNEEILLLGLCRLQFSEVQVKKIRSLTAEINDWNYFSSLANEHGVAALVYHNLEIHNLLSPVPQDMAAFLRGAMMRSLSRNIYNTETTCEVLRLLNKEDIKTVLLKGFALENTVYGNRGLRQMSDVDILISREQCMKARQILIGNGFVSLPVKSFFHKLIISDIGKHLPSLIRNGTSVEIHHELFSHQKKDLTLMLIEDSSEIEIKGEKAYIPRPQIFFLYLVRHLWLHELNNESQLRLYTDLVVLIENYYDEIINNNLLSLAAQAGMSEILARHLEPLRNMWEITFPEWIDDFILKWYNTDSINKFVFFLKSPKNNPQIDKPGIYRSIICDVPGMHRKFLYVLGDIFPTVSFMKKRYKLSHSWKVFFYYPQRIGKILWLFKK